MNLVCENRKIANYNRGLIISLISTWTRKLPGQGISSDFTQRMPRSQRLALFVNESQVIKTLDLNMVRKVTSKWQSEATYIEQLNQEILSYIPQRNNEDINIIFSSLDAISSLSNPRIEIDIKVSKTADNINANINSEKVVADTDFAKRYELLCHTSHSKTAEDNATTISSWKMILKTNLTLFKQINLLQQRTNPQLPHFQQRKTLSLSNLMNLPSNKSHQPISTSKSTINPTLSKLIIPPHSKIYALQAKEEEMSGLQWAAMISPIKFLLSFISKSTPPITLFA